MVGMISALPAVCTIFSINYYNEKVAFHISMPIGLGNGKREMSFVYIFSSSENGDYEIEYSPTAENFFLNPYSYINRR